MKLSFLSVLFALCVTTAAAEEQRVVVKTDLEFASRLVELSKQQDDSALFRLANNPQTNEQLKAALDWMQVRAMYSDERDSRYLFSYAGLLNRARVVDTAILAYLTGMLLSRVEATRCRERSGARATLEELQTTWRSFEDGYWRLSENNRKAMLNIALTLEKSKAKMKAIPWLCSGGLNEIGAALNESSADKPQATLTQEPGKNKLYVDTGGIAPEFLTYEQSIPARTRVVEDFKNYYAQPVRPN